MRLSKAQIGLPSRVVVRDGRKEIDHPLPLEGGSHAKKT